MLLIESKALRLRGFRREMLLDRRAIALEPVLGPDQLAALDGPDLHPAATLVVGRRELHRRQQAAQREALDLLHALLDVLAVRLGAALGLDGVAQRLDLNRRRHDAAVVVDARLHLL